MDHLITMETESTPGSLIRVVRDVVNYPEWLELVTKAEPDDEAWFLTLRANVGPFARSKRLRMVERPGNDPHEFVLVRSETDGREHAEWCLTSSVVESKAGSDLQLSLHYSGRFWNGVLDGVLAKQIEATIPRLRSYLDSRPATA